RKKAGPEDPRLIGWETSYIDIRPLLQYLPRSPGDGAVVVVDPPFYDHGVLLALSSTVSGHDRVFNHCWQYFADSGWVESMRGYAFGNCPLPQGQEPTSPDFAWTDLADRTITQWELRDINGDGYPDLGFNTTPVGQVDTPTSNPGGSGTAFQYLTTRVIKPFDFTGPNEVKALLNVAGVHFFPGIDAGSVHLIPPTSAFSAPITLD